MPLHILSVMARLPAEWVLYQVDNHLSDGVYPVLLGKREETEYFSGRGDPQALETPFLQMTIIKEVDNAKKSSHFNYVAFRCDGCF